jgi:hypothetical protein
MKNTSKRKKSKPQTRPNINRIRTAAQLKADMPKLRKALPKEKWPRLNKILCELEEIDDQLIYYGYRRDRIVSETNAEFLRDKQFQIDALKRLFEGAQS